MDRPRVVAVVVARAGSRRIPRKAHALIGGEGLVERKLRQLSETRGVDRVVLGTDDETLRPVAERHGAVFVAREARYCDEVSETPDAMVRDMLSREECRSDVVLWAHPTNPLVGAREYEDALATHDETGRGGVYSAYELHGHIWYAPGMAIFDHDTEGWLRWPLASDIPPMLVQDGAIFVRPWADMARDGMFANPSGVALIQPREVGWDVNEPWELEIARALVAVREGGR